MEYQIQQAIQSISLLPLLLLNIPCYFARKKLHIVFQSCRVRLYRSRQDFWWENEVGFVE